MATFVCGPISSDHELNKDKLALIVYINLIIFTIFSFVVCNLEYLRVVAVMG